MKLLIFLALLSFIAFAQDEEESEAQKFMRISCEKQRVALACYNYANMLIRSHKEDQSEKFFELGCKLEHSPSCRKERWIIPEVVIKKAPQKPEQIETENNTESSQVMSAFDIKAPADYKGSTPEPSISGPDENGLPVHNISEPPSMMPGPSFATPPLYESAPGQ